MPVAGLLDEGTAISETVRAEPAVVACTRCGRVLMRAHALEPWGELSYLARHYVIVSPDRGRVLRVFSDESAYEPFAALLRDCPAEPAPSS
ncbi:hypothetical protein [Streptomyces sp. NPDC090445]|uniref:hypothetical protein n=1 Tax=Streptomyces sp. NPDC090445 TaxID=3365963 RepID=UPI0038148BE6